MVARGKFGKTEARIYMDATQGTDGSKAGIGLLRKVGKETREIGKKIEGLIDINTAEAMAVKEAVTWAGTYNRGEILIVTDSDQIIKKINKNKARDKITLEIQKGIHQAFRAGIKIGVIWQRRNTEPEQKRAERIAKTALEKEETDIWFFATNKKNIKKMWQERGTEEWQNMWEGDSTGRRTFRLLPTVTTRGIETTHYLTQILTGHGNFKQYLTRFRLTQQDDLCMCGEGREDVEHVLFHCNLQRRVRARQNLSSLKETYPPAEDCFRTRELSDIANWAKELMLAEETS